MLTLFRKLLRDFRLDVEGHLVGEAKFDLIRNNMRAVCLLSYLSSIAGNVLLFDNAEAEKTVGDCYMLGPDIQYLLRYCLVIHLTSLKDKGISYLILYL